VSGTPISAEALRAVGGLPALECLNLTGTSIDWWFRWRLRRSFPRLRLVATFVT